MAGTAQTAATFPSAGRPPLALEGVLHSPLPAPAPGTLHPAVLICHPQPATSSMDDPLCRLLAEQLAAVGFLALRFNFRGAGRSEGQQTDGRLEPLDIAGAAEFLLAQPGANPQKLAIVGHAFGAIMALAYAEHDPRIGTVVAVSPPVYRLDAATGSYARPKLVLTGEFDEVAPRHKLEAWLEGMPNRALQIVTGARHLMRGYEEVAAATVVRYLTRWAATPGV